LGAVTGNADLESKRLQVYWRPLCRDQKIEFLTHSGGFLNPSQLLVTDAKIEGAEHAMANAQPGTCQIRYTLATDPERLSAAALVRETGCFIRYERLFLEPVKRPGDERYNSSD
jgi:hypothetical protein